MDRHAARADAFARAHGRLASVGRGTVLLGCGTAVLLIGLLDASVDPLVAMSALYLVPVLVGAARDSVTGALVAVVSVGVWCSVEVLQHSGAYEAWTVPVLNAATRLAVFSVVIALVAALLDQLERAREVGRYDWLTGLLTSRAFYDVVEKERRRTERHGRPLTLAYLDVDDFKAVNDRLGHAGGDDVLRRLADVLRSSVRAVDTVGRLGGDEFAVVMPDTDADGAAQVLGRVLQQVSAERAAGITVGAATFEHVPPDVDTMVTAADEAMYEQKRAGKNGVRVVTR